MGGAIQLVCPNENAEVIDQGITLVGVPMGSNEYIQQAWQKALGAPSNLSSTPFGKTGPAGHPLFFHRRNIKSSRKCPRAAPELNSWLPGR